MSEVKNGDAVSQARKALERFGLPWHQTDLAIQTVLQSGASNGEDLEAAIIAEAMRIASSGMDCC